MNLRPVPHRDTPGEGPAWSRICRLTAVLWIALGVALAQDTAGKATGVEARQPRHARIYGVSSKELLSHVNPDDARAALKAWFDVLGRQKGFILDSRVDIEDGAEIRKRLESHTADLLALDAAEYVELESSHLVGGLLTDARGAQGRSLYSYLLLVNPSSGVSAIAGLRGKNILVYARNGSNTGGAWIDVLLGKEKLGRAASFFASIKVPDKPQGCILPLFFGSVDACVVDEVGLDLAKEMNPQLARLRVLARSRPMVESLIAMPVEPHPYLKELIDAMLSLHEDPRGRQVLMVFKSDRLVRIQPGDLDSARELWRDYYRLPGSSPRRPAGSGTQAAAESNPADRGREKH